MFESLSINKKLPLFESPALKAPEGEETNWPLDKYRLACKTTASSKSVGTVPVGFLVGADVTGAFVGAFVGLIGADSGTLTSIQ